MPTPETPLVTAPSPRVDARLAAYTNAQPGWQKVRDACNGLEAVRQPERAYIPYIMPSDKTQANVDRNIHYRDRAVFVAFTKRTQKGLVGQVFAKDPILDLPAQLEALRTSIDGGAVSWDQQAKQCLSDVLSVGRAGLLVDYPRVKLEPGRRAPTLLQQQAQNLRPTVQYYFAEQIINWRVEIVNGLRMTTLVVLEEEYDVEDDGFVKKTSSSGASCA